MLTLITYAEAINTCAVVVTTTVSIALKACPAHVTDTVEIRGARTVAMNAVIVAPANNANNDNKTITLTIVIKVHTC